MQVIVQSTISIHSMVMLGGLGACPSCKKINILKNRSSEIEFKGISGSYSCMLY